MLDYNRGKAGIDLSDQMASYVTTRRKGVKWHRKLGVELLLGMSRVNAHILYKEATGKKISRTKFRENVTQALLGNIHSNQQEREKPLHACLKFYF